MRTVAAKQRADIDERVDEIHRELAVTKRIVNIIWSILATIGAGAVTLGVWMMKSGVR